MSNLLEKLRSFIEMLRSVSSADVIKCCRSLLQILGKDRLLPMTNFIYHVYWQCTGKNGCIRHPPSCNVKGTSIRLALCRWSGNRCSNLYRLAKINCIQFFWEWKLKINTEWKTIAVFKKGRIWGMNELWKLGSDEIEVINKIKYLGVILGS